MNEYIQLEFKIEADTKRELLMAELSYVGFEGFEETNEGLKAFIPMQEWDEGETTEIASRMELSYTREIIAETNWNAVWESNFEPVQVHDFVGLRADFHPPFENVKFDIVITPKMSFGTGHHATTYQMIAAMEKIGLNGKAVFDFGTGTGVLAIVAAKLGASDILAIDIDPWSIVNAAENFVRNDVNGIELIQAADAEMERSFDVILANINKHIILESLPVLDRLLTRDGILLLSGLLTDDEADVVAAARGLGLQVVEKTEKHNWLCLKLSH